MTSKRHILTSGVVANLELGKRSEVLFPSLAMVSADGSSQSFGGLTAQIGWFGLRVGGHPALSLHSSNETGELSQ